jgi:hypothetical protein
LVFGAFGSGLLDDEPPDDPVGIRFLRPGAVGVVLALDPLDVAVG